MTALLTDNLPLLAGAPNGIKKLRELILELAVRGKLVPQDPSDEPASELLKRIAEEKARLVAEGKIKKQKPLAEIEEEEKPFELPNGWVWRRFGEVFSLEYGDNLPADKRSNTGEYPVYGSNGVVGTHSTCFVDSPCIVVGRKGSAGALNLCLSRGCCVTDVAYYCIPPSAFSLDYAFKLFHTLGLDSLGKGIKPGLNRNEAYELVVAAPPLAEQHRIVAKVDELMALCDRLEAQQADAESAHAQLVQALLDSLTQASDAEDFAQNWRRLAEHFHTLFTTEPSIDALKQTLLQLAVMGKLVPQDPNDEPASELLKRITEEKARLVAEGKLKKQKPSPEIGEEEKPFQLPAGWEWVRLGSLSQVKGGKRLPAGTAFAPAKTPHVYIQVTNMKDGTIIDENLKYIDEVTKAAIKQYTISKDDVYITIAGTIGDVGIVPEHFDGMNLTENAAKIVFQKIDRRWLQKALSSQFAQRQFSDSTNQLAQPKLALHRIAGSVLALPPLAEQHRIVAKVDQLMALCDQLKTRLTQARQLNEQLANTLVEHAVA
ncbi:restriction endonuclease subunit S [Stutzerimonas chloritidismutans]|uniref:restriction endonuclease subunit S n=1 Tax=Stutzerimonas chloritidismutans TaxID=203192 RepID=UPI001D1813FF|nr:restriction endonuclease subunit S [Stutzerimonas chloritidismutans]UEG62291.1 restriction endonuclease subunit S [Stutzerimonas chloritidismutans]